MDEAPAREDRLLGTLVSERYKVVRKLGEGGMGAVYEGFHTLLQRKCAIKVLHPEFAVRAEVVARFHREALAASSIGNAHIVEVSDMGFLPDRTMFMVLEYLDGEDFAHLIEREGPLDVPRTVRIVDQVLDGLAAAHAKGIVHRDLKPENIFLITREGQREFAKILDFGISKILDPGDPSAGMTRTGAALGTPYYMAPEQFEQSRDVDARADLYAIGVILFRALTGKFPHDATSYPMLVVDVLTRPAPSLAEHRPDAPPALVQLVARLLAKKREERFDDCAGLRTALRASLGAHGTGENIALDATRPAPARATSDVGLLETRPSIEPGTARTRPSAIPTRESLRPPPTRLSAAPTGAGRASTRSWIAGGGVALALLAAGALAARAWRGTEKNTPRGDTPIVVPDPPRAPESPVAAVNGEPPRIRLDTPAADAGAAPVRVVPTASAAENTVHPSHRSPRGVVTTNPVAAIAPVVAPVVTPVVAPVTAPVTTPAPSPTDDGVYRGPRGGLRHVAPAGGTP